MAAAKKPISSVATEVQHTLSNTIHPSCVMDPSVQIGEHVTIHANVVIDRGVTIGDGTVLHAGCYIGEDCTIGRETVICQSVIIREKSRIGSKVVIEPGVVIGSDGFGYAKEKNGNNCKVPQVGYVVIEDNARIGPNSAIDRATLGKTIIGKGAQIGNLVQVGHNVDIGQNSKIGDSVGICGSCKIGSDVFIGHGVGLVGHIQIGDGAHVANGAGVSKDVENQSEIMGSPAIQRRQYEYFQDVLDKLPEFLNRIKTLETKLNGSKK